MVVTGVGLLGALRHQDQFGVFHLDLEGDAASDPVVDPLDAATLFVETEKIGDLRCAAKQADEFSVVHTALNTMFIEPSTWCESTNCLVLPECGMATRENPTHESMVRLLAFATSATKNAKQPVRSYADLGIRLEATAGAFSNWKRRGLSKDAALLAERAFGCSADWLLTGHGPERVSQPPPNPPPDFRDRRLASDSGWTLLQDIDDIPKAERDEIIADIRSRAAKYREHTAEVISRMKRGRE